MNKNNFANIFKRIVCLAVAFAFVVTLITPVQVSAKTKTISLKKQPFTTEVSTADASAKQIGKGTYKVKMKVDSRGWYQGYIKFVAPKTKTYKFTVSNLVANDKKFANGITTAYVPGSANNTENIDFRKSGYEKNGLRIASRKLGKTPTSKTGKLFLQEGQVVYLYNSYLGSYKSKKMQLKLVIK